MALLIWVAGLGTEVARADDPHDVQPERPTVATHAGTVAPGWVEIEAGVELDRYDDRSRGTAAPVVIKIGLAQRLQFSVFGSVLAPPGTNSTGASDLAVGVKWRLLEGAPIVSNFAILPSVKVPTASKTSGLGTGTTDVGLLLISSHDLGAISMDVNLGYVHRSGNGTLVPRHATLWTASLGGPLSGRLGWTGELYGYPATSGHAGAKSIVAILGGPTFQIRKWLALDAGGIVRIAGPQPRALYAGVVYNIGQVWK